MGHGTRSNKTENQADVRWLIDGYQTWVGREGVPIVEGKAVALLDVPTAQWKRMGVSGAFVHTHSRGDFTSLYLLDIPPSAETLPTHHLYEALFFVLAGRGVTSVTRPDGTVTSFEWSRAGLFTLPLNAPYRIHNASGLVPARLAVVNNLPMVMKQFRDDSFVFGTDATFPNRWVSDDAYRGGGIFIPTREQRHMWETSHVPDVQSFDRLTPSPHRGTGSMNIQFVLGESTMHAHLSEVGVGHYKKAHVHPEGAHIIQLGDGGYSLYWYEGEEPRRVDWRFGMLHSPGDNEWHQHFNVSDTPSRYLPMTFGGYRYPFASRTRTKIMHVYSVKSSIQIEYEDEAQSIRSLFKAERAKWQASHGKFR